LSVTTIFLTFLILCFYTSSWIFPSTLAWNKSNCAIKRDCVAYCFFLIARYNRTTAFRYLVCFLIMPSHSVWAWIIHSRHYLAILSFLSYIAIASKLRELRIVLPSRIKTFPSSSKLSNFTFLSGFLLAQTCINICILRLHHL